MLYRHFLVVSDRFDFLWESSGHFLNPTRKSVLLFRSLKAIDKNQVARPSNLVLLFRPFVLTCFMLICQCWMNTCFGQLKSSSLLDWSSLLESASLSLGVAGYPLFFALYWNHFNLSYILCLFVRLQRQNLDSNQTNSSGLVWKSFLLFTFTTVLSLSFPLSPRPNFSLFPLVFLFFSSALNGSRFYQKDIF